MAGETLSLGEIEAVVAIRDQFTEILGKAKKILADFSPVLSGIAVGVAGAVAAIAAFGASVMVLAARGAEVDDVAMAFRRMSGSTEIADSTLKAMRTGVLGTIDDFTLMKDATSLLSAGVHLTAEDFGTLTRAAFVLNNEGFGKTKDILAQLDDAMITGRTKVVARMLGVVDSKNAEQSYAASLGVSTDALSDAGVAEAHRIELMKLLREHVRAAGEQTADFGDRLDQIKAGVTNFTDALSVAIAQSPALNAAMNAIADGMGAAFGDNQVQTVQVIIKWVDKFAILIVDVAIGAVQAANVFVTAWSGVKMIILGTLSVAAEIGLLFARLVEGMAAAATHIPVLGTKFKGLAGSTAELADSLAGVQAGLSVETEEAWNSVKGHSALQDEIAGVGGTLMNLRDTMVKASETQVTNTAVVNALGKAHAATGQIIDASTKKFDQYRKTLADLTADLAMAAKHQLSNSEIATQFKTKLADVIQTAKLYGVEVPEAIRKAWFAAITVPMDAPDLADFLKRQQARINDGVKTNLAVAADATKNALDIQNKMTFVALSERLKAVQMEEDAKADSLDRTVAGYDDAMAAIAAETRARMKETRMAYDAEIDGMREHTASLGDVINDTLAGIPGKIAAAFTGGGGLGGAVKSIGSSLGSDLLGSIFGKPGSDSGLLKNMSGLMGTLAGAAIPAIGSLIGPALSGLTSLIGKMFGTAGRDAVREFASGLGGFDAVHEKLARLGTDGEQLWIKLTQGVGRNNKDAAKAAIDEVTSALQRFDQQIAASVQAEAGVAAKLRDIHTITPDLQAALEAAFDAKNPEDYQAALENISGVIDGQSAKTKELNDILNEFGISWTKTGEAAKQAKLAEISDEITHKWDVLAAAGVNVVDIIGGMGPKVNDFVQDARKAGVEVPEAMRKIIQTAIDNGEVFDENGDKVTDLTKLGLTFGTTMQEAAKSIESSMDRLAQVITNVLSPAIRGIPKVPAPWSDWGAPPDIPNYSNDGSGIPTYGPEVFVPRPTLARVGTNGGEYVLHKETVERIANGGGGGDSDKVVKALDRMNAHLMTLPGTIQRASRDAALIANA